MFSFSCFSLAVLDIRVSAKSVLDISAKKMWHKHRSGLAPETSPAAALVGANCISQHLSHISEEFISGINTFKILASPKRGDIWPMPRFVGGL